MTTFVYHLECLQCGKRADHEIDMYFGVPPEKCETECICKKCGCMNFKQLGSNVKEL